MLQNIKLDKETDFGIIFLVEELCCKGVKHLEDIIYKNIDNLFDPEIYKSLIEFSGDIINFYEHDVYVLKNGMLVIEGNPDNEVIVKLTITNFKDLPQIKEVQIPSRKRFHVNDVCLLFNQEQNKIELTYTLKGYKEFNLIKRQMANGLTTSSALKNRYLNVIYRNLSDIKIHVEDERVYTLNWGSISYQLEKIDDIDETMKSQEEEFNREQMNIMSSLTEEELKDNLMSLIINKDEIDEV